jgi:DNA-binding NarL/FixJ family response regulator
MVLDVGGVVGRSIRVAVANRPRLMRDLIAATFADQSDIEVVAQIQDESEIARVVDETIPEFLIIALESADRRPQLCDSLLERHPALKILALSPDGSSTVFYSALLEIRAVPLETSEAGILNALRTNSTRAGSSS